MTYKQYFQSSHCRSNKDDLSAVALKLGLEGLKCPKQLRVEHKICSTICGTPVQAIWDHKKLTELAWGVREGQNLPQNGLNLALEPTRSPQTSQ